MLVVGRDRLDHPRPRQSLSGTRGESKGLSATPWSLKTTSSLYGRPRGFYGHPGSTPGFSLLIYMRWGWNTGYTWETWETRVSTWDGGPGVDGWLTEGSLGCLAPDRGATDRRSVLSLATARLSTPVQSPTTTCDKPADKPADHAGPNRRSHHERTQRSRLGTPV